MKEDIARYDFCVFRIPGEGGRVIWEITNSCNYKCLYCGYTVDRTKGSDELGTLEVYQALNDLKENGFTHIKFTGGEPLKRKDMFDILQKAGDLGFVSDLSTNCSLMTTQKAAMLKALNLKMVHSSIDGYDKETHEALRGPHTYGPTQRGIRQLVEQGVYLRIGALIWKNNEYHLDKMAASISALGVDEIIFSYMEPEGLMKGDHSLVATRLPDDLRSELESLATKYDGKPHINNSLTREAVDGEGICPGVNKFLFINNVGKVAPCTWLVEKKPEYLSGVSLKDHSLFDIVLSPQIVKFLDYAKKSGGCPVAKR